MALAFYWGLKWKLFSVSKTRAARSLDIIDNRVWTPVCLDNQSFFNFRMELFWFSFLSQVLKLYAWEESFLSKITRIRNNELKYLRNASCFNAIIEFTFTCAPFLVSLWVDKHKYRKNKYENDERKPSDTWVYPNLDLHTHLQGRGRWVDGGRRIDNLVYPLQLI